MAFRLESMLKHKVATGLALAALAIGPEITVQSALAASPATLSELLERIAVEDTITDYYALFGGRGQGDFGAFYTDDGILDANGVVRQGREQINALYKEIGGSEGGRIDILINNMRVSVHGATATADLVWTECSSQTLTDLPKILEQGREHDELVKTGGRWRLKKRIVTNDGGLPKSLLKGYIDR